MSAQRQSNQVEVKLPEAFRFLWEPARYKAAYGGRGSAKSHSIAAVLLILGTMRPIRVLCAREIQKSIKDSVKRLLDDKIDELGLGWFYDSVEGEIRGKNDTLFMFAGLRSNPDAIKSMEGLTHAWVEEAHAVSRKSLEILTPTVRGPGSEIWFSWNPNEPSDPVDEMFRGGEPPPNSIVREVSWRDNPWFPEVLRQDMEFDRRRDPDRYAHVWLGEYLQRSEARVFHNWRVEEFDTPDDVERFYFGADWGYSVDPTVLIRIWIKGRTLYFDHEAYGVGVEIEETPALFDTVPGASRRNGRGDRVPYWPIVADSARPETISYMRKQGFDIKPARKGPSSVMDGIEFMKNYDIVIHPRCTHTADEFQHYRWKVDPKTDEVLPILEDKKNHVIDAGRYALEGVRRSRTPELHLSDAGKMDSRARP